MSVKSKKEDATKKSFLLVLTTLTVGATLSWAQSQELDSLVGPPLGLTLKAKLSDGTTVTEANLGGNLGVATVQLLNVDAVTEQTNCEGMVKVIGSSLGTSNFVDTVTGITNVVVTGILLADNSEVSLSKGSLVEHFGQDAAILRGTRGLLCGACPPIPGFSVPENVISNSVWLVTGVARGASNSKTSFVGQVTGIWKDGETAFKGTLKSVK